MLSKFLQALCSLTKECEFAAVSAQEYTKEMIRDTFKNGLASPSIRQRLLEQEDFNLQKAYDVTLSFSSVQKQANKYVNLEQTLVVVKNVDEILNENTEISNPEVAAATTKVIMKNFFVVGLFTLVFDVPQNKLIVTRVEKRSFLTYVSFKKTSDFKCR